MRSAITKNVIYLWKASWTSCALCVFVVVCPPAALASGEADSLAAVYEAPPGSTDLPGPDARLEDYLVYAANQSPALKTAFYRSQAELEKTEYAGALPDPRFTFGYFAESVETRVGPQQARLALWQSLPWFGTLGAKKDVSLEAANAAYERFQSVKLDLFFRVESAYVECYYLGRDIAITRENFQLLEFWESVVRARYRVALTQHPDVIKAQVELGRLEDRLKSLEERVETARTRLRAVVNLPDDVPIPIPTSIDVEEIPVDRDSVVARVLANNPDLKSLGYLIDKGSAAKRLADKTSWPEFVVGVEYIATGEAVDPTIKDSGKDPWIVSVGVSLPIWLGKNKARQKEAEARYLEARHTYTDARNNLAVYVDDLVFRYSDALRKTRLYRDGLVPKAEQALNVSYAAYEAGTTDFLSLLDAQRQLLDFQLSYERAKSDLAIARAEIEMLTGEELNK